MIIHQSQIAPNAFLRAIFWIGIKTLRNRLHNRMNDSPTARRIRWRNGCNHKLCCRQRIADTQRLFTKNRNKIIGNARPQTRLNQTANRVTSSPQCQLAKLTDWTRLITHPSSHLWAFQPSPQSKPPA